MLDSLVACLFILIGSLSFFGSATNADWLMKSPQVAFLVKHLKKSGARILYAGLGLLSILVGLLFLFHV